MLPVPPEVEAAVDSAIVDEVEEPGVTPEEVPVEVVSEEVVPPGVVTEEEVVPPGVVIEEELVSPGVVWDEVEPDGVTVDAAVVSYVLPGCVDAEVVEVPPGSDTPEPPAGDAA